MKSVNKSWLFRAAHQGLGYSSAISHFSGQCKEGTPAWQEGVVTELRCSFREDEKHLSKKRRFCPYVRVPQWTGILCRALVCAGLLSYHTVVSLASFSHHSIMPEPRQWRKATFQCLSTWRCQWNLCEHFGPSQFILTHLASVLSM